MKVKIFIILAIIAIFLCINNKNKSNIEKYSDENDVIQRITGIRKKDVPYNSSNNQKSILVNNTNFHKQQRKRLMI